MWMAVRTDWMQRLSLILSDLDAVGDPQEKLAHLTELHHTGAALGEAEGGLEVAGEAGWGSGVACVSCAGPGAQHWPWEQESHGCCLTAAFCISRIRSVLATASSGALGSSGAMWFQLS